MTLREYLRTSKHPWCQLVAQDAKSPGDTAVLYSPDGLYQLIDHPDSKSTQVVFIHFTADVRTIEPAVGGGMGDEFRFRHIDQRIDEHMQHLYERATSHDDPAGMPIRGRSRR